jgi:hypothetical protein
MVQDLAARGDRDCGSVALVDPQARCMPPAERQRERNGDDVLAWRPTLQNRRHLRSCAQRLRGSSSARQLVREAARLRGSSSARQLVREAARPHQQYAPLRGHFFVLRVCCCAAATRAGAAREPTARRPASCAQDAELASPSAPSTCACCRAAALPGRVPAQRERKQAAPYTVVGGGSQAPRLCIGTLLKPRHSERASRFAPLLRSAARRAAARCSCLAARGGARRLAAQRGAPRIAATDARGCAWRLGAAPSRQHSRCRARRGERARSAALQLQQASRQQGWVASAALPAAVALFAAAAAAAAVAGAGQPAAAERRRADLAKQQPVCAAAAPARACASR